MRLVRVSHEPCPVSCPCLQLSYSQLEKPSKLKVCFNKGSVVVRRVFRFGWVKVGAVAAPPPARPFRLQFASATRAARSRVVVLSSEFRTGPTGKVGVTVAFAENISVTVKFRIAKRTCYCLTSELEDRWNVHVESQCIQCCVCEKC